MSRPTAHQSPAWVRTPSTSHRKTGTPASRARLIRFGIVKTRSGWSGSVLSHGPASPASVPVADVTRSRAPVATPDQPSRGGTAQALVQTGSMGMMPRADGRDGRRDSRRAGTGRLQIRDRRSGRRPARSAAEHGASAAAGGHADWPAYHANSRRSGSVSGLPAAGRLALGWSRRLDGAVYGQPLVIGRTVIAATEQDTVYGLSLSTGASPVVRARWPRPLPLPGQPCGNIDPIGITSTPVYYRGLVYALAQDGRSGHVLVGLEPGDRPGAVPAGRPVAGRTALLRSAARRARGRRTGGSTSPSAVISVTAARTSARWSGVPAAGPGRGRRGRLSRTWCPARNHAGIWAPGGPVIGPGGTVYVGVGNGGTSAALRRLRLGDRALARPAPDRRLRSGQLGRR